MLICIFADCMALKLTIDQGNTAAKAAVWHDDSIVAETVFRNLTDNDIIRLAGDFGGIFDASIYSSVKDSDCRVRQAMSQCSRRFIELSATTPLPVKIDYKTPSTLGRDRIAAVAGAYSMLPGRTALVVDAGTAITYDVLLPDGTFPGGNIAPGLWMRAESLHRLTDQLPLVNVETPGDVALWGTDTPRAITAGVVRGVAGEIDYYRRMLPPDAAVVLTGGDAVRLAPFVPQHHAAEVIVEPALVPRGLNCILDYNRRLEAAASTGDSPAT